MSINGKAYIVGAYEHPTRKADDKSVAQLHADVCWGALQDAGLSKDDADGFFCTSAAPGLGPLNMADYLGLTGLRHMDSTDVGGSSYVLHVVCGHPGCSRQLPWLHSRIVTPRPATSQARRNTAFKRCCPQCPALPRAAPQGAATIHGR
ncbi:MAG: hypothetical protein K2X49_12770 [Acetobacteraceae bacterium]|nr:hypothetical protein [Acetobacteraceae bacterium]